MPLTPSGKINRKALPDIDLTNISNDVEYVKPQTELQKELGKLMEKAGLTGILSRFFSPLLGKIFPSFSKDAQFAGYMSSF